MNSYLLLGQVANYYDLFQLIFSSIFDFWPSFLSFFRRSMVRKYKDLYIFYVFILFYCFFSVIFFTHIDFVAAVIIYEFFSLTLADAFPLESDRQQVSSLLDFKLFWSISKMLLLFGWSQLILWSSTLLIYFLSLWGLFQALELLLVSPPISCTTAVLVLKQDPSTYPSFNFFHFLSAVSQNGKIYSIAKINKMFSC